MAPATDRQILEALYQSHVSLLEALRLYDSRRDKENEQLRAKIEAFAAEMQEPLIALLTAHKASATPKVTVTEATPSTAGKIEVTMGSGDSTSRFQLSDAHWLKVRPVFVWLLGLVATALGLAKLLTAAK